MSEKAKPDFFTKMFAAATGAGVGYAVTAVAGPIVGAVAGAAAAEAIRENPEWLDKLAASRTCTVLP